MSTWHRMVLVALIPILAICETGAHTLSVSEVFVETRGDDVHVELDVPLRDLALAVGLDRDLDDAITWGELVAAQSEIEALAMRDLVLMASGSRCPLQPTGLATREREGIANATLSLRGQCATDAGLLVEYRLLTQELPGHAAIITLREGTSTRTAVLRGGSRAVRFGPPGGSGSLATFASFLREGIHHILIGFDHIAFLLSLLLPAALARSGSRWVPVRSRRESFRFTLAIVTAFTVAHSITLSLAALGLVRPAQQPIEVAIAASVVLAALNNIRPVITRRLWLAGFVFGLIHGFGFAGALGELGLAPGSEALALLGFNLGVEVGQIAIVCLALPVLLWARHRPAYARIVMPTISLLIALLACYWLFERLAF